MKKKSLSFFITLAFGALFIFLILSFTILLSGIVKKERFQSEKRSFEIAHFVMKEPNYKEFLELFGFVLIENSSHILESQSLQIIWHNHKKRVELIRYKENKEEYLLIKRGSKTILLLDKYESKSISFYIVILFFLLLLAFGFLYFRILGKLKPLTSLTQQIRCFGDENFEIECAIDADDEIAALANEFENAAKKLQHLKESRNIFIRNIMHELKTPIAKGQILAQLEDSPQNRENMQELFYRLESLINEFASIEELLTTQKFLEKKRYKLSDLLENSIDLLLCDATLIQTQIKDAKIEVNFKFFSIALKNLLDNGLKHSSDKRVILSNSQTKILIENRGEALLKPLESYFEPFSQTQHNTTGSFGLGLYIVKHILDAHGFRLEYAYDEGVNKFFICLE